MIRWTVRCGDILDEQANVLICSANVFLNLSGGVGGGILLRYGPEMQHELHQLLTTRGTRHVEQGDIVITSSCGTPFNAVVHAVAVDGFYQSTPAVIQAVVTKSLVAAASTGARRVALTALATGYGRLSIESFGAGVIPLLSREFPPIEEVVICVRKESDRDSLVAALLDAEELHASDKKQ